MLEYDKIFILLGLFHQTADGCKKFIHFTVDQCYQKRLFYFLDRIQNLIIVVDIDKGRNHLHFLIFNAVLCQQCLIKQIDHLQILLLLCQFYTAALMQNIRKMDLMHRSPVHFFFPLYHQLQLVLFLHQFPRNLRKNRSDRFVISFIFFGKQLKLVVHPQ